MEGASVLLILSPPDKLGISVGVPWVEKRTLVRDRDRIPFVVGHEIPKLLSRDVGALVRMSR